MSRDPSMDFQWQNLLETRNYVSLGGKSKEKIFFCDAVGDSFICCTSLETK